MRWCVFFLCLLLSGTASAGVGRVRNVYLDDQKIESIVIRPGKLTTLHFPLKPDNAALGMKAAFDLTYIVDDINIGALRPLAETNLKVYLLGRRFTFELTTQSGGPYDEIVNVFDADSPDAPAPVSKKQRPRTLTRKTRAGRRE